MKSEKEKKVLLEKMEMGNKAIKVSLYLKDGKVLAKEDEKGLFKVIIYELDHGVKRECF